MFSSEERRGLGFVVIGGLVLIGGLLVAIGFFSDSKRAEVAKPSSSPLAALKLGGARGRVVDARTSAALVERVVTVEGLEGLAEPWFADVDPKEPAAFEVRGLPSTRPCTLAIACDGHVTTRRELRIETGKVVELGDVALTPLATIAGTVVDVGGAPLAGAHVELIGVGEGGDDRSDGRAALTDSGTLRTDADARGAFRFVGATPRKYTLVATTTSGETALETTRVDATRGGELEPVRVVLAPTFTLHGRFEWTKESAPPIAALVRVDWPVSPASDAPLAPWKSAVAADGAFVFENVRAPRVRLVALIDAEHGVPFDLEAPFDATPLVVDAAKSVVLADALAR